MERRPHRTLLTVSALEKETANGYFFPTWRARFAKPDPKQHGRGYLTKIFGRACKRAKIPWGIRGGGSRMAHCDARQRRDADDS